jgi:hypothetical protein
MRLLSTARLATLIALCCLSFSASSQTVVNTGVRPIGAGAFPLSFTDASAWLAHRADNNEKVLTVLFYFHGSPGWLSGKTDFKWQVNQSPATIDMLVGSVPIRAKYWQETDEVEVQGKKYRRSADNVFVIGQIDTPSPVVTALGVHNLTFKPDDVPSVTLLRRDPDVWAAVTGHSRDDHPLGRKPTASEEITTWDQQGLQLLESGQPDQERKGCELFRRAAEKGYAPSQYRLGYCYESGKGVEQNFSTANQWYEKAGAQDFVDAQYKLGHSYRTGRGAQIDLPTALAWYKKAAGAGDRDALHNVGWMYATGQGTKADQQEAYRWFLEAAQHGEPGAQFEIARRLKESEGVSKDLVLAYSWLLVLKAQQSNFPPEDWTQIQTTMTSVEGQLDAAGKKRADEQCRTWMAAIAKSDMDAYSHQ